MFGWHVKNYVLNTMVFYILIIFGVFKSPLQSKVFIAMNSFLHISIKYHDLEYFISILNIMI
jgi:hypothetical protein